MPYVSSEELSSTYLLSSLVKKSSVPAFSRVGQAEAKPQRIFWLSVLLLCLCGCGYETSRFLRTFFQYPVLIDVETENSGTLDFPAVTVCNLNRVADYHSECFENNKTWSACIQESLFVDHLIMSERKMYTAIPKTATQLEIRHKLKLQKFFDHYTHLDYADRKCYGYRLHQLVTNCNFNSMSCQADNFSYFQSIQYGNCYTFNKASSNHMESSRLAVRKVGQDSGLDLELDTLLKNYIDFSASAGMRVIVHNADEDPNPEEDGFNIVPGYETQVSLTKVSIQRLPAPYRDRCRDYKTTKGSQFDCIRECQQEMAREKCGCVDPFLQTDLQASLCNLRNKSQMSCLDDLLNNVEKAGLPCECPLSCMSTTFKKEIGMAMLLPRKTTYIHSPLLKLKVPECDSIKKRTPPNQRRNKRSLKGKIESKAKLKIFYRSLDHTKYIQRAMFSDSELYAHLGGHLGLWLGLSCIALFECVEYLALLFYLFVSKRKILPK
ncbi:amiloride-sensitive sodium channel subunit alpha [Caerostris darwini]|uniref:Amiloride-sensitive sodium channel subunit alpha n=1 Tax=Caerostris darwini TaxID=1538125 RepID=A0AAV4RD66_9ARAC|nr:amiloride-sensitive sodium channel subunit alpha [Caerostris darwini]